MKNHFTLQQKVLMTVLAVCLTSLLGIAHQQALEKETLTAKKEVSSAQKSVI